MVVVACRVAAGVEAVVTAASPHPQASKPTLMTIANTRRMAMTEAERSPDIA